MLSGTLNFRSRVSGLVVALALCLFVPALRAQLLTENRWTGAVSGQWNEPGNWSEGHVPYSVERARIDSGTVAADTIGCVAVALNGGTLTITGSLNNLSTTVGSGATLVIAGDTTHFITGTLTNHGVLIWQNGDIDGDSYSANGHIINTPDGVFDIWCDKSLGSSLSIDNQGTILKSAGSTLPGSVCPALITSSGSIIVHTGNFDVGNILELAGVIQVTSGASFRGHGYMRPLVLGPTSRFEGEGSVVLDGTITGTLTGHARLDGQLHGDLTVAPGSTATIEHNLTLTGVLTNHGTIVWQDDGTIFVPSCAIDGDSSNGLIGHIVNAPDGLFDIRCDGSLGTSLTIDNQGTIRKSVGISTPGTLCSSQLTSSGSIIVQEGSLDSLNAVAFSGLVHVEAGAAFRSNGYLQPVALAATARFEGDGSIVLVGNHTGTLTGKATLRQEFGGDLTITAGSTVTLNYLQLSGNLTVSPSSTVMLGDFSDSGNSITGTLTNHGTLVWLNGSIDNYYASEADPCSIINASDGVFDIRCDRSLGSGLTFDNQGTLIKTGENYSRTDFIGALTSSGKILVHSGGLNLAQPITLSGLVSVDSGATFSNWGYSSMTLAPTAHFEGDGAILLSGDITGTLSGKAQLTFKLSGNLTIAPDSTVTINDTNYNGFYLAGTLTNHGTILWLGGSINGDLDSATSSSLINEIDGTCEIRCDESLYSDLTFDNKGLLIKTGGATGSRTIIGTSFSSSGTISIQAGELDATQPISYAGSVEVASGATFLSYARESTATITATASFGGAGDVFLEGWHTGTITGKAAIVFMHSGDLTITPGSTVTLDGGLYFSGTITNHGTLQCPAGWYSGDGIINEADGVLTISCTSPWAPSLQRFDNRGMARVLGSLTSLYVSGTFANSGQLEIHSGAVVTGHDLFQTAGAIRLSGGRLWTAAPAVYRQSGGDLVGAGTITGNVVATGGAICCGNDDGDTLHITGTLQLGPEATLASTARSSLPNESGRLVVDGAASLAGHLSFALVGGFVPTVGSRFHVLDCPTITGTFASASFPTLPTGVDYFLRYTTGYAEVVVGVTSLADWKALHFGAATDPAIVGDNADPDGDGIVNLLEYAFGLEPLSASRAGLPVTALQPAVEDGLDYLTMTFTSPTTVTDLDLTPQVSGDLADWQSGPGWTETISDTTSDGTRTVIVRDTVPISGGARRFMRLRVQVRP